VAEGQEQRGDLIFWKGHVAMIVDDHRLIHANGHTMSVAYEGRSACIARILAQEDRPVIARRRPV
jgi:cell wall-associated NlpC family hydrolase